MPLICVLIPYYEDGCLLLKSLSSLELSATLVEVCIVDDGSVQKKAADILHVYSGSLSLKLISFKENRGIEFALNSGLEYCLPLYKYVLRLDCGDVVLGQRILLQFQYLENNPDAGVVGGWVDFVDLADKFLYQLRLPILDKEIRKKIFLNSPFIHPAIMVRSEVFKRVGGYPTGYPAAEDLAFFFEALKISEGANLPVPVVACLINPKGISNLKRRIQIKSRIRLILKNFDWSIYSFFGLFRAFFVLYLPRQLNVFIRRILK